MAKQWNFLRKKNERLLVSDTDVIYDAFVTMTENAKRSFGVSQLFLSLGLISA